MSTHYTSNDNNHDERDYENIIRINSNESDFEEEDYDLDYDPNEMYYALMNDKE